LKKILKCWGWRRRRRSRQRRIQQPENDHKTIIIKRILIQGPIERSPEVFSFV
jgi:hypothetical protein